MSEYEPTKVNSSLNGCAVFRPIVYFFHYISDLVFTLVFTPFSILTELYNPAMSTQVNAYQVIYNKSRLQYI